MCYNKQLRRGLDMMTYEMQYLKNKKKLMIISLVGVFLLFGMFLLNQCIHYETVKSSNEEESVLAVKK